MKQYDQLPLIQMYTPPEVDISRIVPLAPDYVQIADEERADLADFRGEDKQKEATGVSLEIAQKAKGSSELPKPKTARRDPNTISYFSKPGPNTSDDPRLETGPITSDFDLHKSEAEIAERRQQAAIGIAQSLVVLDNLKTQNRH